MLRPFLILVLCWSWLCGACSSKETADLATLDVVVDADLTLRTRVNRVVLESESGSRTFLIGGPKDDPRSATFPFSARVSADPGRLRGVLRVRAFEDATELVRVTSDIALATGGGSIWGVYLTSSCIDVFKGCDDEGKGTCAPCTDRCGDDRAVLSEPSEGVNYGWKAPSCDDESNLDAAVGGADGGPSNSGPEDAAMPMDAMARDGEAGDAGDGGAPGPLSISGPSVVAAPGCVPYSVLRSEAGTAQPVTLSADALHVAFFGDAACTQVVPTEFAAQETLLEVFLKPSLGGELVFAVELRATSDGHDATKEVEIRSRARQIIRGEDLACALLEEGRLQCMGLNTLNRLGNGQTNRIQHFPQEAVAIATMFPPYSRLSSRDYFSCGIALESAGDTEGPIYCWGGNNFGQLTSSHTGSFTPVAPAGLVGDFEVVATGIRHSCALNKASELWCWGNNSGRVIADDAVGVKDATKMTVLDGIAGAVVEDVSPGYDFTCASTTDGKVYCWGTDYGPSAIEIDIPGSVRKLGGTSSGTCAINTDEEIYCFQGTDLPVRISGIPEGSEIDDLKGAFRATCARVDNHLYCWGQNPSGWLGTSNTAPALSSATRVLLPEGRLESFALAGYAGVALSAVIDGLVYSWGYSLGDNGGSLGIEMGLNDHLLPERHPMFDDDDEIITGPLSGCSLTAGAGGCWGPYTWLGRSTQDIAQGNFSDEPLAVPGLGAGVTSIEVGSAAAFANRGTNVLAWGNRTLGALGDSVALEGGGVAPPVQLGFEVSGDILAIGAAGYKGCVLIDTKAGTDPRRIYCWGDFTQPTPPEGDPRSKPFLVMSGDASLKDVDVSADRACALVDDAVQCWADKPAAPEAYVGLESGVRALEMGAVVLCAIKENDSAQCSFAGNALTTPFASVSSLKVGAGHACGLVKGGPNAGQLWCAGQNGHGQLGTGDTIESLGNATPVKNLVGTIQSYYPGHENTCARDSEGMKCWGDNGQNALAFSRAVINRPMLIRAWGP